MRHEDRLSGPACGFPPVQFNARHISLYLQSCRSQKPEDLPKQSKLPSVICLLRYSGARASFKQPVHNPCEYPSTSGSPSPQVNRHRIHWNFIFFSLVLGLGRASKVDCRQRAPETRAMSSFQCSMPACRCPAGSPHCTRLEFFPA